METLVKRLHEEMQSELELINPHVSPVKGYDQNMKVVKLFILQLERHVTVHLFPDKATEIKYFKHWLPSFYKLYIYFSYLYKLERSRISSDTEKFIAYLEKEKKRISIFLNDHEELFFYHLLGETDRDEILFIRAPHPDTIEFMRREKNFCHDSFVLAELLAYGDYKKTLDEEIELLTREKSATEGIKLKWKGSKADAVEFIVLLYETKLCDHEGHDATLEQLKEWMRSYLQVELKDFTVIDNKNRMRKKTATPLLDKFARAANDRAKRLDP